MNPPLRFPKSERLRHRILIEDLFNRGESFYEFPFRVNWKVQSRRKLEERFRHGVPENIDALQMMVTVPKKKRKKAVDRVLLRRRIREAYRLNRLPLLNKLLDRKTTMSIAFVYIHDRNLDYSFINSKITTILAKLISKLEGICNEESSDNFD